MKKKKQGNVIDEVYLRSIVFWSYETSDEEKWQGEETIPSRRRNRSKPRWK